MCGIAGLVGLNAELPHIANNLLELLKHRGPDDHGWLSWQAAQVQAGHDEIPPAHCEGILLQRRLSILDLSANGRQPFSTPDGRFHLTFNGEIYNYQELRAELERAGYSFRSTSDTEVLLTACAAWGRAALNRLVGMFAFALLDLRERKLLLARDCFGIKPLYYVHKPDFFAFASEIRTLLAIPGVGRRANVPRLHEYLRDSLVDHDAETLFADIQQVPSAHFLEISLDDLGAGGRPERYWRIDLQNRIDISFEEATRELRERFLDSVRLHMRSDVPVGAALSGGIDSTAIVMAMRHLQGGSLALHSFSFVANDAVLSEEKWIDLAGQAARATIHKVHVDPDELQNDLDRLVHVQDVPFGSTSIYAQYRVFRLARENGIKVMLDGQGADELFAGYRTYVGARLATLIRRGEWWNAASFAHQASRLPGVGIRGALKMIGTIPQLSTLRRVARGLLRGKAGQTWLNAGWLAERGALDSVSPVTQSDDFLRHELHRTLVRTSLPQLLRYEDRNSMAFSIESRVPFLTPGLAEFVLSLPEAYLISPRGVSKWVFREAMRGIVPDAILDRRDKIGFATPETSWLRALEPWVERVLQSETARRIGALNHDEVLRQWQQIRAGKRPCDYRVWRWVNLIQWTQRFDVEYA
ncbi:MAG: asparagine synthase (glutamine-hydrolyzing) [Gemmataceae bacterium]